MNIDKGLALAASAVVFISVISGILAFFFWERALLGLVSFVLVLTSVLSRYPEKFSRESFGFELGIFFAICACFSFGLLGVLLGAVYIIVAGLFIREPPQDTLVALFCILIITVLACSIGPVNIVLYGLGLVLLYDILCLGVYSLLGHSVFGGLRFMVGHLLWNYVLFSLWAEWLVAFLSRI